VRTQRWRFVNNSELYDISSDPYETTNVADAHPEVVAELSKSFDKWWDSVLPLMVNEGLPKIAEADQPLAIRYNKQLQEMGIPEWAPAEF
jgi:arylsulfatase